MEELSTLVRIEGLDDAAPAALVVERQELAVWPQRVLPAIQNIGRHAPLHALEVVAHEERTTARATEVRLLRMVGVLAAARAFEVGDERARWGLGREGADHSRVIFAPRARRRTSTSA